VLRWGGVGEACVIGGARSFPFGVVVVVVHGCDSARRWWERGRKYGWAGGPGLGRPGLGRACGQLNIFFGIYFIPSCNFGGFRKKDYEFQRNRHTENMYLFHFLNLLLT
jgi:hypothetical protein